MIARLCRWVLGLFPYGGEIPPVALTYWLKESGWVPERRYKVPERGWWIPKRGIRYVVSR